MIGWCLAGALLGLGMLMISAGISFTGSGAADQRSHSLGPYYVVVGVAAVLVSLLPLFFD